MCLSVSMSVIVASVVATLVLRCCGAGGGCLVAGLIEVDVVALASRSRVWSGIERRCHTANRSVVCWAGGRYPSATPPPPLLSVFVRWYCVIHPVGRTITETTWRSHAGAWSAWIASRVVKFVSAYLHGHCGALVVALGKPV